LESDGAGREGAQRSVAIMTGTWQGLVNQPGFATSTMMLLTDGRVMVQ
jgi:hypothetical protein